MSLIIRISKEKVVIPKLGIEFTPTLPPDNLTRAALESFTLLRSSHFFQTDSNDSEKKEVIELLSTYGYELYQSIIPASVRQILAREPDLRIYQLDHWSQQIPWELLYNGISFLVLTNGVTLSFQINNQKTIENSERKQSSLRISLNSFPLTLEKESSSNLLIHELPFPVFEKLANSEIVEYPNLDLLKNNSATQQSIIKELDSNPDVLVISTESGKMICGTTTDNAINSSDWLEQQFIPHLTRSADSGLKIFILKAAEFFKEDLIFSNRQINSCFETGVPFIICCCGQLAPDRFLQYLKKLIKGLLEEKNILVAHRQALNVLSTNLAHSWDWSLIRLFVADNLAHPEKNIIFKGFHFHQSLKSDEAGKVKKREKFYLDHPFAGSIELLETILQQFKNQPEGEVLYLEAPSGQLLEQYIFEVVRRDNDLQNRQIGILNYPAEDLLQKVDKSLDRFKIIDKFSFLFQYSMIEKLLDASLVSYQNPEKRRKKLLIILSPPTQTDPFFDHWLQNKQRMGWKAVILGTNGFDSDITFKKISLDFIESRQLLDYMGDNTQIDWSQELPQIQWESVKNFLLVRILKSSNSQQLLNIIKQQSNKSDLWRSVFTTVISKLSPLQQEIFWTIFLLRPRLSRIHLDNLIASDIISQNITVLVQHCLIETDVKRSYLWISFSLYDIILQYKIYDSGYLERLSRHLLVQEIRQVNASPPYRQELTLGFFHCAEFVSRHFSVTVAIKRVIQFGKGLTRSYGGQLPHLSHCIRFILNRLNDRDQNRYLFDFLFSCADLIEAIKDPSYQIQNIAIYERLMILEDQVRNWQKVSEIQLRLSSLYVKTGHTDKAIGLLTAALQLNSDLKNRSKKYSNLIQIALLLLDLGEVEKVEKLVEETQFFPETLSKENMTLLWLIDGHLHYEAKRYKDAYYSFYKYQQSTSTSVPNRLRAKTCCYLAQLLERKGKTETARDFLIEAVRLYNLSAELHLTKKISDRLIKSISCSDSIEKNIVQLEKLLRVIQNSEEVESINSITNLLGGFYHKVGNNEKSIYYYKLTQKNTPLT
jgi:tetratricopeptide (TPR) repeat protein